MSYYPLIPEQAFCQNGSMTTTDPASTVEGIAAAIAVLAEVDLDGLDARALLGLVPAVEVQLRRLAAQADRLVEVIDRTGAYTVDGHFSARSAITHLTRVRPGEAGARVQVAKASRHLPELTAAYQEGRVPVGSMRAVANVAANPRVTHLLAGSDGWFTEHATTRPEVQVRVLCAGWERHADLDGAEPRSDRDHDRRHLSMNQILGGPFRITGTVGALQGALMADVLAAYEQREFEADLAEASAQLGRPLDAASDSVLPRTSTQRRADALLAIFRIAGSVNADGVPINDPTTTVLIDQDTFERAIALAAGADIEPRDPAESDTTWCQTLTGHTLGLLDAAEAAFVGHVRRAVINADGVIVDYGRSQRLFRGHARDAVLSGRWPRAGVTCAWPGCTSPLGALQIDHIHRAADGGPTNPHNGHPHCGRHNRLKEAGYTTRYHTGRPPQHLRPDRTPITAAA